MQSICFFTWPKNRKNDKDDHTYSKTHASLPQDLPHTRINQ